MATSQDADAWEKYKADHGRNIEDPAEDEMRKKLFLNSKQMVDEHNKKYEEGLVTFTMALNKFSDRTKEEIKCMTGVACKPKSKDSDS